MRAVDFDSLFQEHVASPLKSRGFGAWGKSLYAERDGLQIGVLRTEVRSTWPFKITLVVRHAFLRDFDGNAAATRLRKPSEYPVKARPSLARSLLEDFRYEPLNLGAFPGDEMVDGETALREQLNAIGAALVDVVPLLGDHLTSRVMIEEIERRGEDAWCERRWLEDYRLQTRT